MSYITKEGMQYLQKRMKELMEERPKVINQVAEARDLGDLSENAEYHAAREKQRYIDSELNSLKRKIGGAQVIDPSTLPKDSIRFGFTVKIQEEGSKNTPKHRIVGIDEIYQRNDDIVLTSIASPLGKALLGKKNGDIIVVKAPKGDLKYKVLDFEC